MIQALQVVGMVGQVAFIIGIILTKFVPSDKPSQFFKRHKIISGIFIAFVCIGFVTFIISLPIALK